MTRYRSKKTQELMREVAEMGCCICRSPAELHHPTGAGMALKARDEDVIPLCPFHHRLGNYGEALHAGVKEWEKLYGTQEYWVKQTKERVSSE